jgi:hypothetical protein
MLAAETSPAGQALPEEIGLPGRAYDIRGKVFGKLTALRPVGNNQLGVLWLCECECGRHAIRSTAKLRIATKNNVESQCAECAQELRRGTTEENRAVMHEIHLLHWYTYGSLYSAGQLETIEQDITENLREIEFPVGQPHLDVRDGHGHDQPEPYGGVCDGAEHTLAEIGVFFDVTPERVRQMCLRAMEHLLHKHRRLLVSLLTGEFDWRVASLVEVEPEFIGCRCKAYERSAPGYIYCKTCGQVWQAGGQEARILTEAMLRKATIFE